MKWIFYILVPWEAREFSLSPGGLTIWDSCCLSWGLSWAFDLELELGEC